MEQIIKNPPINGHETSPTELAPTINVAVSADEPPRGYGKMLGVVEFGNRAQKPDLDAGYPTVGIMTSDSCRGPVRETWTSTAEVSTGRHGDIVYGHDGTHLFGAFQLPRADRYREATRTAYRELTTLIADLGYPHLVRMWNYIADINDSNHDGLEVYRDFCQGRAEGFDDTGTATLPAATGVGSLGGGVSVYFVAERSGTGVHFENPRQVPAYQYPRRYGPRPPSFARATLLPGSEKLFLSGTASIVGHQSVHVGDLEGQFHTTVENIRILLEDAAEKSGGVVDLNSFSLLKVYVRHSRDAGHVRQRVREVVGAQVPVEVFNVDICRSELLLEIEGVLNLRLS